MTMGDPLNKANRSGFEYLRRAKKAWLYGGWRQDDSSVGVLDETYVSLSTYP